MRVIFAGTPAFAAKTLETIIAAGHQVVLVLTQPDRPSGRGMKLQASAVKAVALAHQIPVFQPERLKDPASHEPIQAAAADIMVVAAYGLILPQAVLDIPRRGCLNIHASLLPRWRGAAPIHRAIEAGDKETGICIMQMDAGLDTGPTLLSEALAIEDKESTGHLHDRLAALGAHLIVAALEQLDQLSPQPQSTLGVSYAKKISKEEAHLDWSLPASELERKVRAFNPAPGATVMLEGKPVKLWRGEVDEATSLAAPPGTVIAASDQGIVVVCGRGIVRLLELQNPGGRRQSAGEFLRGSAVAFKA